MLKRRTYGRLTAVKIKNKKNIKKKALSLLLLITMVSFGISLSPLMINPVKAVDVTWVGGTPGDWCTDANWSNGVEPTSADNVTVSSAGVLNVTTSGCVTEGHDINFSSLTIGDGANANTLTLSANIGTGTDITIKGFAILTQDNTATQTISGTLTVESGGLLTHSENPATHSYEVDFQAATIEIAGSVNLDERGYTGGLGAGDGNGTGKGIYDAVSGNGSGGAHSGNGGATASNPTSVAGGVAYCNNNNPSTLGSGGGGSDGTVGGDGGGLALLKATASISVSGTITANGDTPTALGPPPATGSGGGGAGAIKLDAPIVDISGATINAVGGNSNVIDQGGGGGGGCVFISYSTSYTATGATTSTAGGTGANNGGAGSFISNALPTITTPSASQTSASIITAATTITDLDKNITSMIVEYSTDNITWASSTLANVTQDGSGDGVTTSTGQITGIDTDGSGSQGLTIEWNASVDVPDTDDTSVYLRFIPADSIGNGTTSSSIAFAVDTKSPTAPGALSVNSTSTTSVDLNFGSATVDTGFSEYKIFYTAGASGVTEANTAFTSSSDVNLDAIDFNSVATTTISNLTANTQYVMNIWAYDVWSRSTSSTEMNFYTLANVPSAVSASADSTSQITVYWTGDGSQFYAENITAGTNSGWTANSSYAFSNLTASTQYSFRVKSKNAGGVETGWSSTVSATTQNNPAPIPVLPPPPDPIEPEDPDCVGLECPVNPSGLILINNGVTYTKSRNVTLHFNTQFTNKYAVSESGDFAGLSFLDIVAQLPFAISSVDDGEKVVYARFTNDFGTYDAYDIIILDTIAPEPPTITIFSPNLIFNKATGQYVLDNPNKQQVKLTIAGLSEPLSLISIVNTRNKTGQTEVFGGFKSDSSGNWSFNFPNSLFPEVYSLTLSAFDLASNESLKSSVVIDLSGNTKPVPEPEVPESKPEMPVPEPEVPEPKPEVPINPIPGSDQPSGGAPADGGVPSAPSSPSSYPVLPSGESESKFSFPILEQGGEKVIGLVIDATKPAIVAIQKVINNPRVELVNEKIVAPVVVIAGVANIIASVAVGGFQLPAMLALLRYLFTQPFLLLRLKKRKNWGIIYNSFSKKPVDLATVRIIDTLTNRVVSSQVTDSQGRYLLTVNPGTYTLEIIKPGYIGFSEYLHDVSEDSAYINLYHGGEIKVDEPTALSYNIPIDPVDKEMSTIKILRDHTIKTTQNSIALVGLIITVISFVISPTSIIALFFFLHLLFYSVFYRFSHVVLPATWGKVMEKLSQKPLGKVVIRVFDSAYNKLVETGVTDRKGRYAILVGPSKYYATYDKPGYKEKKTPVLDYSSEKTRGMGGILNVSETLEKQKHITHNT